jgi:hypothetical protein
MSLDTTRIGLCWYDGSQFGVYPMQDGSLPHAQIPDMEVREVTDGYELWMSCLSRGIAVLHVTTDPVGISSFPQNGRSLSLSNYPNPFNDRTTISFSLAEPGPVGISIVDISGRLIRNLAGGHFDSGTSTVEWDGCDNQGTRVSPGIYACRLIAGDLSASGKMVVY